ncbi:glutathione peroxidase [Flavobacterium sp.]
MRVITKAIYNFFLLATLTSYSQEKTKAGGVSHVAASQDTKTMSKPTIYNCEATDIDGKAFNFEKYRGYKILIVNTASKCGYTPQYEELQQLYKTFSRSKFIIVAFPSNDFGEQEPGENQDIKEFCTKNYGVTFPVMEKVSVKGKNMCSVYQFLTQKRKNGVMDSTVDWNFQKYLINENGELEKVLPSKVKPMDDEIVQWIKKQQ